MNKITHEQAGKLWELLGPSMRLLRTVFERLEARGYRPGDKLYDAAREAWEAVHTLSIRAHYLSCESGVGVSASADGPDQVAPPVDS